MDAGSKNRQCVAFIESKGRQCVRWANEGDVYCCVHLASRFTGSFSKIEATPSADTPMCEGTTVLGTRCKHRSLYGSSFCKKHRPKSDANNSCHSPEYKRKRKHLEIIQSSETTLCRDIVLVGDNDSPLQVEPVSVIEADALHRGDSAYTPIMVLILVKKVLRGIHYTVINTFQAGSSVQEMQLGTHWMENHKKEAQRLFEGYACAICLDSFTNKKVLESHVQERHHVQFVEQCMLIQCISCGSHFGNTEELWLDVLSAHPVEFRLSKIAQQHNLSAGEEPPLKLQFGNSVENNSENVDNFQKFTCKYCGLKFDLLPDLGRHHQAAHMGPSLASSRPPKKGVRYYAYKLKSGRLSHPRFKKGLGAVSYRIRNRATATMKKRLQASKLIDAEIISAEPHVMENSNLGRLAEPQCSALAKILFSRTHKTKPQPNNLDILSIARSSCCKVSLKASLEGKYGMLPECLYLKAAKLCSEHNIQVEWHQEKFVCINGCKPAKDSDFLPPLNPLPNGFEGHQSADSLKDVDEELELDECHYIINSLHFKKGPTRKASVLCDDLSSGKESVPVACVVDEGLFDSLNISGLSFNEQNAGPSMPWENFTYVTSSLLDQSLDLDVESMQLGCTCSNSTCCPETCDHVYLFDNDYEDARDIYGKPMRGRFPYDDKGRIILEEGYLVYECNHMCSCNKACPNRVLQKGVRVKLEVFKTENKGWGIRAGEPILSGTFVCEYVGILGKQEANDRLTSCSPNLVNRQVLVDSMDCHRAHIGLYASQDISVGEELTLDYRYELLPGQGYPCQCGASTCRGRLY
ncbi:Histone-lysine N-methyltransferase SUVR5 -like protein [Gossypium arboreum]|uniref:Histone-lysine N-methyltransferase SUVR5-like protein n=1 Tax=Gossypium arboreum TaxID=29729 RepID=A0A0B0NSX7_GOSAR|nr:Histone-lysine N-methyltransferase SUVR5 -like protein [Gossypium arboreum]